MQAEEEWQFLKDVFNSIKGPIEMNLMHLEGELKMFCKLGGSNILPLMADNWSHGIKMMTWTEKACLVLSFLP